MFSIFIVEDELLIAEMLKEMLFDLSYNVAGVASNYESTINFLSENEKPDLCLVDINLESEKNGFDLVKIIKDQYQIPFIFLTSYSDKKTIQEAVSFQPEAYIIKPFKLNDLYTTIEIAKNKQLENVEKERTYILKDGNQSVKINLNDIIWIKSDNIYIEIMVLEKKYLLRQSLDGFLDEINVSFIIRTHRSYAINLNHLKAINGSDLIVGNDIVPISRRNKDEVLQLFKK